MRQANKANSPVLPALVAAGLLAFFLSRYPVRGFRLPMGPDAPVYLWWSRLAGLQGLSVTGTRPGVPALVLAMRGTLHLSLPAILGGLGAILGAATGIAAMELVWKGRPGRPVLAGVLAGAFAGTFAVHLAGGYFPNLAVAALFLAAATTLACRSESSDPSTYSRAPILGAAALLAAGGLAHPLFFVASVVVLAASAPILLSILKLRTDLLDTWLGRIGAAAIGAGVVVAAGLVAMLAGPSPLSVDTSADAFLRRAGLTSVLRHQYLERLSHHWARYELWFAAPLAWFGRNSTTGFVRRFLRAYAVLALAALVISTASGALPGARVFAFAYGLPILAALGLDRLAQRRKRWEAAALVAILGGAIVFGAALTWWRERPYMTPEQVSEVATAVNMVHNNPPGTPIVFVVDDPHENLAAFHATDWGNVIRAIVPPDRIRDVHVYFGSPANLFAGRPTLTGTIQHDALSRTYLSDLERLGVVPNGEVCVLPAFSAIPSPPALRCGNRLGPVTTQPAAQGPVQPGTLQTVSPWTTVAAGLFGFLLLCVIGYGWALAAVRGRPVSGTAALSLAPCYGIAALILSAVLADRIGASLASPAVVTLVSAGCGLGGYATAFMVKRSERPARHESPA